MRGLAAALTASALTVGPWASRSLRAQEGPPSALEGVDVERVYRAGQVYRRRWLDAADDLAVCEERRVGAERKLSTRTSTAIRNLVVPPVPEQDGSGVSPGTVVAIAFGVAALSALATFLVVSSQADDPVVIVNGQP